MHWAVSTIPIPSGRAEELVDLLAGWGWTSFSLSERDDGNAELVLYAPGGVLPEAVCAGLAALGFAVPPPRIADDAELLRGHLPEEPSELAPGAWVDPRGTLPPDPTRLIVRMPPVPAFGDGTHPTTRLAAALLLRAAPRGRRVLDLGCGTGVLGILALRAGAIACDFSDYDQHAVAGCAAVLAANDFANAPIFASDLLQQVPAGSRYDLVVANLYGELLLELAADPRLAELLPQGTLVLSGMSAGKASGVLATFAALGFRLVERREDGFWNGAWLER